MRRRHPHQSEGAQEEPPSENDPATPVKDNGLVKGRVPVILEKIKTDARAAVEEASRQDVSQFQNWTSDNLRDLLARHNIQVRGASSASHETLVWICEDAFGTSAQEPRHLSIEDVTRMNMAARIIQQTYFLRRDRIGVQDNIEGIDTERCSLDDEQNDAPTEHLEPKGGRRRESSRHTKPDTFETRQFSMLQRIEEGDLGDELSIEWRKPSWKFAKKFEAVNRPHRAGKEMAFYNWRKVTLGRHCTYGGCGEQLDLWDEGRTSEFSQFGSGITNYFKFLKWCCWLMVILSCIHLPVLIINLFGASMQYESSNAALTTFGNLGGAKEITIVRIPGCSEDEYRFDDCTIKKDMLAIFYALVDVAGTLFVVLAWLWLKKFQRSEVKNLNRSTVTASDYTLCVQDIPRDTDETELGAHFSELTGEPVAAVHLAYANAKEINQYFKRGKLMRRRFDCVQRIRYEMTKQKKSGQEPGPRQNRIINKLMQERDELTSMIQMRDEERSKKVKSNPPAIQAFVTFESEKGMVNAVASYQQSWFRRVCCCYPNKLIFKGLRLQVSQAPEPSTIIWENLEVSNRSRLLRKFLTTGTATLAILLSVLVTFLSRDFQDKVRENSSKACPDGFSDLGADEQYDIVQRDTSLAHCYCSALSSSEQWTEEFCRDYVKSIARSSAMKNGASFMVVFMNAFFTWLMDRAGSFEKHHSLDAMEKSNMTRVFFLKFVNTGCLVLLYNQKWLQRLVRIKFDDAPDFNVDWYATGGVALLTVMVLNAITPHIGIIISYLRHRARIWSLERHLTKEKETEDRYRVWYTQEELNNVYLGPYFCLNYRYTQCLVNFFICYIYAIGMPIMPMIGAISFYISYWVDKFMFCKFYRTPPMYSDDMGRASTKIIGLAVVVHLVMSAWMMGGDNKIFMGKNAWRNEENPFDGVKAALFKRHLIILEAALVLYISGFFLSRLSSGVRNRIIGFLRCLLCCPENKAKRLEATLNTVQINYSSACQRGVIKGIASYNILQNPKYQEAFGISAEFAQDHKHVSSIRGFNTKEGGLCGDSDEAGRRDNL